MRNTPTAAEQHAALLRDKVALGTHLENTKAKRDSLSPSDPAWRKTNAETRDLADELTGYAAAIAELVPKVDAERSEVAHARRVEWHREAMQAADQADFIPSEIDRLLSRLCVLVPHYLEWTGRCALAGGVETHPYSLGETFPSLDSVRDVILGRLVAGGIMGRDFLPALFEAAPACFEDARAAGMTFPGQSPQQPLELAAAASVFRDVHGGFKKTIRAADPDRLRREQENIARDHVARMEREAAEAQKPRRVETTPPPVVHGAGRPVSQFSS